VNLVLYRLEKNTSNAKLAIPSNASWAQFGEAMLLYAEGPEAVNLSMVQSRSTHLLKADSTPLRREHLHVVVQNGRMFQQENPKVPVILDKGRYLLVKLDSRRARRLKDASPTCFGIFRLKKNQVVFDAPDPDATRVQRAAWVHELIGKLDRTSLESTLTHMVSFPTRHSTSSSFRSASTWARD